MGRTMLAVKWLVVRCVMYLFRLPDYRMTQVAVWWFGNRTKYIRRRTTSHLTIDMCPGRCVRQDLLGNQFAQAGICHGDTAQAARVPGAMPPITVTKAATASAANTGAGKRDGAGSSASFMYMRTATRI